VACPAARRRLKSGSRRTPLSSNERRDQSSDERSSSDCDCAGSRAGGRVDGARAAAGDENAPRNTPPRRPPPPPPPRPPTARAPWDRVGIADQPRQLRQGIRSRIAPHRRAFVRRVRLIRKIPAVLIGLAGFNLATGAVEDAVGHFVTTPSSTPSLTLPACGEDGGRQRRKIISFHWARRLLTRRAQKQAPSPRPARGQGAPRSVLDHSG